MPIGHCEYYWYIILFDNLFLQTIITRITYNIHTFICTDYYYNYKVTFWKL